MKSASKSASRSGQASSIPNVALVGFGMLAVGALPAMGSISFWSLLHLTFIAVSVAVLIARSDTDGRGRGNVLRVAVLPLLFCYLRAEFVSSLGPLAEFALGTTPVILLAAIGLRCLLGHDRQIVPRPRTLVAVVALLVSATLLGWALAYAQDPVPGLQKGSWVPLVEVALLAVASYLLVGHSSGRSSRVVGGIGVAPFVVGTLIGWWMMGSAYGHFRAGRTLFADGNVEAAKVRVTALREDFGFLKFEPLASSVWIRGMVDDLGARGTVQLWTALAEMAVVERAWGEAAAAYQKAFGLAPNNVDLRIRSVQCLFEAGYRYEAIAALDAHAKHVKGNVPVQMARAISHARMGEIGRANQVIDEAIEGGWGIREDILRAIEPGGVMRTTVGELLPAGVDVYGSGVTLYDVVGVLQARGISVLNHGMVVGSTKIQTPRTVEILTRPLDDPAREQITAGAEMISTHKGGCTVFVVNPENGAVESRLLRSYSGRELAKFLQGVPDGHIVAGAIDDVGPWFLTDEARQALERVGIRRFPNLSWAHAFVGVQGAQSGTALQAVSGSAAVSLGILAGNMEKGASPAEIEAEVRAAARTAEQGIGLYISGVERDSEIAVARAGR